MLSSVLLLATLFSCKKEIQDTPLQADSTDQTAAVANVAAATYSSSNLLYEETCENGDLFSSYVTKQIATSWGLTAATKPVFAGLKSARFELRSSDPLNNNGTRAEISFPTTTNLNRWYSFAAYFPSADYLYDDGDEVISQWYQHQHGTSSPISLRTKQDRLRLTIIPSYKATSEKIELGAIPKDKWNTFVIHIVHSTGSDGLIELWLNGNKIVNRTGRNMYDLSSADGLTYPSWKMGIYKSGWNTSTTSTTTRVLYYDNVKYGNEKATLSEMMPGSATTEPAPTPTTDTTTTSVSSSAITSYTLVNAATEKDIMTITNGSTISLSKIGVSKLNIRANTASALGSVKFELSGAQSKTSTDSKVPYALQGDDGAGNYYYGNWNPPALGTYTLKSTPYSGGSATGTAGSAYSISFTITN